MYHSVANYVEDPHRITVSPHSLSHQLRWLSSRGFRGVSIHQLSAAQMAGQARGLVGLTFDDGYDDFAIHAVPILRHYGFTATVFMVASQINGINCWDDGPRKKLMTAEQLRSVVAHGMEVGSHGLRHELLPHMDFEDLQSELRKSRQILEETINCPVTGFAYPYGRVSLREVAAVRAAGYDYACAIWPCRFSGIHCLARAYIGDFDGPLRLRAKNIRHRLCWGGAG